MRPEALVQLYILRRLLLMIPVLFGVSLIIFGILRALPGDAIDAELANAGQLSPQEKAQARATLGLDKPLWRQYLIWVGDALRGDLGTSFHSRIAVTEDLRDRIPVTAELALLTLVVAIAIGIPIGILSAARSDSPLDYVARSGSVIFLSMPTFWIGIMLLYFLSRWAGYFPPYGQRFNLFTETRQNLESMVWPALTLGLPFAAVVMRLTRSQMLEILRQDYIRTAWAKGLRERAVIARHALKNAMIPVVTVVGNQLGFLLGGTVVTEQLFSLPGVGRQTRDAIFTRDYPVLQANILLLALSFLVVNLIVDLIYARLDPRIRYS
jgi:peptide/nickel transport system permease protein